MSTKRIEMLLFILVLVILGGVWTYNGFEDTWLYASAGIIAIPVSWFYFGKKKDK